MSTGVLFVNFGEPDEPTLEKVTAFLERIFLQNAPLEGHAAEAALARTRQLARDRAPGLLEEYEEIGGSPLNAQSEAQTESVSEELARRGIPARVYSAYQFTDPTIAQAVAQAREDGVETLVALTGYPLCGESTTVAALDEVRRALNELGWSPDFRSVSGWHHHPRYLELRAEHIREFVRDRGLDLRDPDTILYFSMHGTPLKYLRDGNRYDRYVFEHCRDVAAALGAERWAVGFQNHSNRGIPWTQPENEERIKELEERTLVVAPISFMKEQSETLAELDHEMKEFVEGLGKEFHRVPVPHDHPELAAYMADLVEELLAEDPAGTGVLGPCRCRPGDRTWCTNGHREVGPSPYLPEA
ncbi:MAG: ferrochelatase [Gemmatimonadales bacterium]|jgi:ferrochelatase|nr:MAG: ferrochelatase [Gemmatimonadales bacterium]